jgi:hypothetical protein
MRREAKNRPKRITVQYGTQRIPVAVTSVPGDRLSITVHPDMRVTVRAPDSRPLDAIIARVRAKAPWIVRQRKMFASNHPFPTRRQYVSGETHLYMGRQYRLRIRADKEDKVALRGAYIHITTSDPRDTAQIRNLLDRWYACRMALILSRRVHACCQLVGSLGIAPPVIAFRSMWRRWGSCTRAGRIVLNPGLVRVPMHCMDYVIVHELCHLRVLKHDRAFYRLLGRYMPDWERRKRRLNQFLLPD